MPQPHLEVTDYLPTLEVERLIENWLISLMLLPEKHCYFPAIHTHLSDDQHLPGRKQTVEDVTEHIYHKLPKVSFKRLFKELNVLDL
jgi:hypothetical protein